MAEPATLDRNHSAVLIMDFQVRIINNFASDPQGVIERAAQALQGARQAGLPIIYIVHRGGPFREDAPDVEIHPGVAPAPGESVITKTKPGSFSTTGLDITLREMGVDTLILMGVATSGCVLSTIRWAVDINYKPLVVADACSDPDPEVHRVLTEKVYPRQGTVLTTDEFCHLVART
ncbi:MAG: cysteine hydrolase [Candidatus Tectomicrobia bacterium]